MTNVGATAVERDEASVSSCSAGGFMKAQCLIMVSERDVCEVERIVLI